MLIPLEAAGFSPALSVLSLIFSGFILTTCGFLKTQHTFCCTSENLWLGRRAADRC